MSPPSSGEKSSQKQQWSWKKKRRRRRRHPGDSSEQRRERGGAARDRAFSPGRTRTASHADLQPRGCFGSKTLCAQPLRLPRRPDPAGWGGRGRTAAISEGASHLGTRGSEALRKRNKGTAHRLTLQVQNRNCCRSGPLLKPGVQLVIEF